MTDNLVFSLHSEEETALIAKAAARAETIDRIVEWRRQIAEALEFIDSLKVVERPDY